jgi:hypothetical protein
MCGHQKTLKENQPLPVEAPKYQHLNTRINSVTLDMNMSLLRILQSDIHFQPYKLNIL